MNVDSLNYNRAILDALKCLQDKIRSLEDERTTSVADLRALKGELVRLQEDYSYMRKLHDLSLQEQDAASRLAYEKLLASKAAIDINLDQTEEVRLVLQGECATARDHEQEAIVAQMSIEARLTVLERRVQDSEESAQVRKKRKGKAQEDMRHETAATDTELSSLTDRIEILQRTLRDEQSNRKVAEIHHQRASAATARTNRYLEGILQVNQDLVSARTGGGSSHTAPASTGPPAPTHAAKRQSNRHGRTKSTFSRIDLDRGEVVESNRPTCPVDVDVGSAVGGVLNIARAGGDPVPFLQALYERIGFSAIMQEDAMVEGSPFDFLPTSPQYQQTPRGHATLEGADRFSESGDSKEPFQPQGQDSMQGGVFFAGTGPSAGQFESTRGTSAEGRQDRNDGCPTGSGLWQGDGEAGYSFAHSPRARAISGVQQWPRVVRRLEDLAELLEREKSDVERWYKTVVDKATPDMSATGRLQQSKNFDAGRLTRAIACLQDKAQQLEVVRESLGALKAPPKTGTTLSAVDSRRKAAAMHVLRACTKA